jgi:exodeoxyribonuclease V beta subunit
VSGYRYGRDFGGVIYLFVRGFDASRSPTQGVYFHQPEQVVIQSISAVLDGEKIT